MKGKLNKSIPGHVTLKQSSTHLRFGSVLGCAPGVETHVPWFAGAAWSLEGVSLKALTPVSVGLSN